MIYAVQFHPAVRKDLRRIAPQAREKMLKEIVPSIGLSPLHGTPLTGTLRGYWKYRVFLFGVWYRIVYIIDTQYKEVIIIALGPRGEFYEKLKQRVKNRRTY